MKTPTTLFWSTPAQGILCPPEDVFTQVLIARLADCVSPEGAAYGPTLLAVRVRVSNGTVANPGQTPLQTTPRSLITDFVRLHWSVGQSLFVADLDVVSGVVSASLVADYVRIEFFNSEKDNPGALVTAAVCPTVVSEGTRIARRSVAFTFPAAAAVQLTIPEGASKVEFLMPTQGATGALCKIEDSKGGTVGNVVLAPVYAPGGNSRIHLPGGSSTLLLSSNPAGADLSCIAVFETPL